MSFQSLFLRHSEQVIFIQQLNGIEVTLSKLKTLDKPIIDKISKFFESNNKLIVGDEAMANRIDSIASKVRRLASDDPLVDKVIDVGLLALNINTEDNLQSLADGIDLLEIPLSYLNLSEEMKFKLIPKMSYIDISNLDLSNFNFEKCFPNFNKPNFKLNAPDKETLYNFTKLFAQQYGGVIAENIKKFEIEDKNQLLEIAKLCAQNCGGGTAHSIKNFGIEDQTQLIEIAKLCAIQNGAATAIYIKNFNIKDQAVLLEIAKFCIQQDPFTLHHLKCIGLQERQLLELAKFSAQEDGGVTACYIQAFEIQDKHQLLEIAKLCAQQDGYGTAKNIQNFGIEDESHLYEIAKLCANQNGKTAQCIQNFRIEDTVQIFEIAKLCAMQNGTETIKFIHNFGINNPQMRWELFLECIKENNECLFQIGCFFPLPDLFPGPGILTNILFIMINPYSLDQKANQHASSTFFIETKRLIANLSCSKESKEQWVQIAEEIEKSERHIQNEAAQWLLKTLFLSLQMPPENHNWLFESNLLLKLFKLREPRLRNLLTPGLFECSKSKNDVPPGTHGLALLIIPFSLLQQQGVNPEKIKQITLKLKKHQNKSDTLKSALSVQNILHTFHLLAATHIHSSKEKIRAIDKIFFNHDGSIEDNIDTVLKRIAAVRVLLQMKNNEWANSNKDPVEEFSAAFEKLVSIKEIKGVVAHRYEEIFGKSRNPYGLITYAAGLKTLNDPKVMECLSDYVSSVFNNTFVEKRYDTTNNLHLKTISERHQDVLELWKQNFEIPLETSKSEEKKKFDPEDWIKTKLIDDGHLGKTEITFIRDYFRANLGEERELICKQLTEELQKDPSDILKLQKACIAFAEAKFKNLKPFLEDIKTYLDPRTEFYNDVKQMLEKKKISSDLKIVITDDPVDLLLCGSDIGDSCQRLDGTPSLNKGLLGYLVDGKNRLLAIKDGKGKIIARCILRLLWDGERPVLFRERFYGANQDPRLSKEMEKAAKDLAKKLNIPITSSIEVTPYEKPLHALGGPAPYEYCDARRGVQNGPYTISKQIGIVI